MRGTRVEDQDPGDVASVSTGNDYFFFLGYKIPFLTAGIVIAVFLLFVGGVVFVILRLHKKKMRERAAAIKDGDPDG